MSVKYRYYSTQRPVTPGAYPKPKNNPAMLIIISAAGNTCRRLGGRRGDMWSMTGRLKMKI